MSKRWSVFLAAVCIALPAPTLAQGIGIGARVGTLGVGGEAAFGLTDRIVVRGGVGLTPSRFEPSATFDDIDVDLTLPTWYNAGLDLYLNSAIRIGGGMLFKSDDLELLGTFNQPQDIGGTTFTPQELGTLTGVIDSSDSVPYVLLGFGRHTAPGFGLFLDVGVAFLGDPDVRLDAQDGTLSDDPATQSALDQEAEDFEADMRTYLQFWPILSLGLRIGLG
jgi:hypothetical protein